MTELDQLRAERDALQRTVAELVAILMDLTDPLSPTSPAQRVLNARAVISKVMESKFIAA